MSIKVSEDLSSFSIDQLIDRINQLFDANEIDKAMQVYAHLVLYRPGEFTEEHRSVIRFQKTNSVFDFPPPTPPLEESKKKPPKIPFVQRVERLKPNYRKLLKEFLRVSGLYVSLKTLDQIKRKKKYRWFREELRTLEKESVGGEENEKKLQTFFEKCGRAIDSGALPQEVLSTSITLFYLRDILTSTECRTWLQYLQIKL